MRYVDVGQHVVVHDYRSQTNKINWQPRVVKLRYGSVDNEIETEKGYIWGWHTDQIRQTGERVTATPEDTNLDDYFQEDNNGDNKNSNVESHDSKSVMSTDNKMPDHQQPKSTIPSTSNECAKEEPKRQSDRIRNLTTHFGSPIPGRSLCKRCH